MPATVIALSISLPEFILGDPATPGDMEPGAFLPGGEDLQDGFIQIEAE